MPQYQSRNNPIPEREVTEQEAREMVARTDVGMIVIARNSGEFADRQAVQGDFYLSDMEQANIDTISQAYHEAGKQVVVVLNIGGPIEMASWRDKVDGILLGWQSGQETGHAIADVLSGAVNPSGKLATTFPMDYSDTPSFRNYPGTPEVNPTKVVYEEDIYLGYRYHTTFDVEPAYEFGYGLSYTEFDYDKIRVNRNGSFKDKITVFAEVKNIGNVAGKEAVQVYVSSPDGKLEKPELELVAFDKTEELRSGKKQNLKFELSARDIASFDEELSAWVVEAGTYEIRVGASSEDIRGTVSFKVDSDIVVSLFHFCKYYCVARQMTSDTIILKPESLRNKVFFFFNQ